MKRDLLPVYIAGILGLLGGSLYWGYRSSKHRELLARERGQVRYLAQAISGWVSDHDWVPWAVSSEKGQDCKSDTSAEEALVALLRGIDLVGSSRGYNYLPELPDAKIIQGRPVGGYFRASEDELALHDSWGRYYQILLDHDNDDRVRDPSRPGENEWIESKFLVWSAGPDGNPDTWDDNICSWK